jgi:hypothetical protein
MHEVLAGKEEQGVHIRVGHLHKIGKKVIKKVQMNSGFDLAKSGIIIGDGWDFSSFCWIIQEGEQE